MSTHSAASPFPARTFWAATLGLALLASPATAGPINWTYTTSWANDGGAAFLSLNSNYVTVDATSPTGYDVAPICWHPTLLNPSGAVTGPTQIRIAEVGDAGIGPYWSDSPFSTGGVGDSFRAGLTITDAATGARGTFAVTGTGGFLGSLPEGGNYWLSLDDPSAQRQVIGGTLYTVRFDAVGVEVQGQSISDLVADVTAGPVTTPEPGTLALAALGLAPLAAAVRRRR